MVDQVFGVSFGTGCTAVERKRCIARVERMMRQQADILRSRFGAQQLHGCRVFGYMGLLFCVLEEYLRSGIDGNWRL